MNEFTIPQELNIADRIGSFTFPQLGFLAFGLLSVMIMFITDSIPMSVSMCIGIPIFLTCIILGFFKKYDMPMYEFLMVLIIYKSLPKEMIYSATDSKLEEIEEDSIQEQIEEDILLV
ncbi:MULTISPECIES: PrgI family mobile element protein [Bacillus]|uniref:PrgI family mobile element protein n=1 Tax=Bacillus TaxID=1386 RepID=UPI00159573E6|nr:PrgI family protein [Bacillus cereus]